MITEILQPQDKEAFVEYCATHRHEVDDTCLSDNDLACFEPGGDNPTCIIKDNNRIIAAASLILDDYHRSGRNGRFRIFHSERSSPEFYSLLLAGILKHADGVDKVSLFVPAYGTAYVEILEQLSFTVERYVFVLVRQLRETPSYTLPAGYSLKTFQPGRDEAHWCHIRNTAFSGLRGNSTPKTPAMIKALATQPDYLEGGMMLLYHGDNPVGLVRGAKDAHEGVPAMGIGPIALLPVYQGKGLGRQLLRAALRFAENSGYEQALLCVNGENEKAKALYLQEGFIQAEAVTAYEFVIR